MMCKTGKKILIIEDTKSVSMLLSASLQREGFRVDLAESIKEARNLLLRNNGSQIKYDVALVDINLPDGDGADILRELASSSWCDVRYAVSADTNSDAKQRALEAGADRYIVKPFNIHTLIDRISNEVGGRNIKHRRKLEDGWVAEKNRLARSYADHLNSVCKELEKPMSFKMLKSRLHQLRGSAMLYGFRKISVLASDLSDRLMKYGPSFSDDAKNTLRQEIRITLGR